MEPTKGYRTACDVIQFEQDTSQYVYREYVIKF
jgi:hypothetical protein